MFSHEDQLLQKSQCTAFQIQQQFVIFYFVCPSFQGVYYFLLKTKQEVKRRKLVHG